MKTFFTALFILVTCSCPAQIKPALPGTQYGAGTNSNGAITVSALEEKLGTNGTFSGRVKGTVVSVCEMKGCWMKLKQANGEGIMIKFKDYRFFMPKDITGKEVVIEGDAKTAVTPVKELQHFAEDAGKSKEEIARITQPRKEVEFIAKGVLVL